MSLYKQWTDMVVDYVKTKGEQAFWDEYGAIEENIYTKLLATHNSELKGTFKELAEKYKASTVFFMGFLDGINESLEKELPLENFEENTEIDAKVNFEKLYFNMLDAKADYLYTLSQWDGIFSEEKRKEIRKAWSRSKIVVKEEKIGRNDLCPCGSGKKYKKCCGAGK